MRAAEADKTEGELAGVVRRLKLEQQGAQLDCAICLRRVRPAALRSTFCSVGFVVQAVTPERKADVVGGVPSFWTCQPAVMSRQQPCA